MTPQLTRRRLLAGVGGGITALGGASLVNDTGAFNSITASRSTRVSVADDQSNAVVGLEVYSPVGKNPEDPLVTVENNTNAEFTVTISLETCSDGTLYGPQGGGGSSCTVDYSQNVGGSETVDIKAAINSNTLPFTISVDGPDFAFDATRETTAVARAIRITKVQKFTVNAGSQNDWTIDQVQVQDNDGDDDLDRVEYEIVDANGTVRATRTDSAAGGQYQAQPVSIAPDDSTYDIATGETYTLTVTGYDSDGNYASTTREDTATGGGNNPNAIRIKNLQKFRAHAGADDWSIGQVQIADNDGDKDLDRVEYEIVDSNDTVRATLTDTTSGQQYQVQDISIDPDDSSYDITSNATYTLTVTGYDVDGNFDSETRQDTA